MKWTKLSVLSLCLLGALTRADSAFATVETPTCAPPISVSQCADEVWNSMCGSLYPVECFELAYACSAADLSCPAPQQEAIPWPEKTHSLADGLQPTGMEIAWGKSERFDKSAIEGYSGASDTVFDAPWTSGQLFPAGILPVSYVKRPSYESTSTIADCRDYVYKKYHAYQRFEDSAEQCKTADCVFEVAYYDDPWTPDYQPPGIAYRTLMQKDGVTPMTAQIPLFTGVLPKNAFFGFKGRATAALRRTPKFKANPALYGPILDQIDAMRQYYKIGTGSGQTHPNMWAWHEDMHNLTSGVSRAERLANQRRIARFQKLLEELNMQVLLDAVGVDKVPSPVALSDLLRVVPGPSDGPDYAMVSRQDPFAWIVATQDLQDQADAGAIAVRGDWYRWVAVHPTDLPVWKQAMLPPAPAPLATPMNGPLFGDPTYPVVQIPSVGLDAVFTTTTTGNDILDLLVAEWQRPNQSCLAAGYHGCDWTPEMFAASVQGLFQEERQQDYTRCTRSTSGTFVPPQASVASAEAFMATQWLKFGAEMKGLDAAPDSTKALPKTGNMKEGGKSLGVPGFLGAEYNYQIGWSAEVLQRTAASPAESGQICRIGATAKANFGASAWYPNTNVGLADFVGPNGQFSFDSYPIRYVQVADVKNEVNVGATATIESHAIFVGQELYTPIVVSIAPGEKYKANAAPPTYTMSETSQTFWVAFIPVTVAFGLDVKPSVDFWAQVTPPGPCNAGQPVQNVTLGFQAHAEPSLDVGLHASAAVGITGCRAGLEGRLTLVRAAVPVKASLGTGVQNNTVYVKLDHEAKVTFDELGGRVSLFAEVGAGPFKKRWEKEIFAWDGLHQEAPLWRYTNSFDVLGFNSL